MVSFSMHLLPRGMILNDIFDQYPDPNGLVISDPDPDPNVQVITDQDPDR